VGKRNFGHKGTAGAETRLVCLLSILDQGPCASEGNGERRKISFGGPHPAQFAQIGLGGNGRGARCRDRQDQKVLSTTEEVEVAEEGANDGRRETQGRRWDAL